MKNGVLLGFIPAGYNPTKLPPSDLVRLTEKTIKNAPADERPYKLFDSQDYTLSLDVYPKTRLKQARQLHRDAQNPLAQGTGRNGNRQKSSKTVSGNSHASGTPISAPHGRTRNTPGRPSTLWSSTVFPHVGGKATSEILPPTIVNILSLLADDKPETRTHIKQAFFAFAIQAHSTHLVRPENGTQCAKPDLAPVILATGRNPRLLSRLNSYPNRKTALALHLLILTLTRGSGDRQEQEAELRALHHYNSPFFITSNGNQAPQRHDPVAVHEAYGLHGAHRSARWV